MTLADHLRGLISETARETDGVGALAESVKWGEPSFAPVKPRIGSSVRLQERANGDVALMFICHTGLVGRFRELYGDTLALEGNRAIVLSPEGTLPADTLKHCIAMALTYHLGKRGTHPPPEGRVARQSRAGWGLQPYLFSHPGAAKRNPGSIP